MSNNGQPPASSGTTKEAASSSNDSDLDAARRFQAIEQLTSIFGFPEPVAITAVDAVGFDATACYNYILDNQLAQDAGGPVVPIDNCPHVDRHVRITPPQLNGLLKQKRPQEASCSHTNEATGGQKTGGLKQDDTDDACHAEENWICLECGVVRCSRYENSHAQEHWNKTRDKDSAHSEGHCVYISFSDLSVWCNCCGAYVQREPVRLSPLLNDLEKLKFLSQEEREALPE